MVFHGGTDEDRLSQVREVPKLKAAKLPFAPDAL